jgi:hypothetical protein
VSPPNEDVPPAGVGLGTPPGLAVLPLLAPLLERTGTVLTWGAAPQAASGTANSTPQQAVSITASRRGDRARSRGTDSGIAASGRRVRAASRAGECPGASG